MAATALTGLVLLLVILLVIWTGQRHLMYFPAHDVPPPAALGLTNVEQVMFPASGNVMLHGWFLPSLRSPTRFTVVVFNGNAGNRAYRAPLGAALRTHGLAVLLLDYRGYGGNPGTPTEGGLSDDARAARAYLLGRRDVDPARLVYFGESLGTAVATRLAAEHPPAALILRSPFASMAEVGQIHYPVLPVRWLLRDRFAAVEHIAAIRCPLLVIAGDRDSIVPFRQSRRLYDAAPLPKTLAVIEGADHNDEALLSGEEMIGAIVRFLDQVS